jgi:undecaprenyl pyrophosphate synthase
MSAPRSAIDNIASKYKESVESMKYMKTAITGMTEADLKIVSLDHQLQAFETELADAAIALATVAQGYTQVRPLGDTALNLQIKVLELAKTDTNEFMKQHADSVKAFETLYRNVQGLITHKINNVPNFDGQGLIIKVNGIINGLSAPEVKAKLTGENKSVFILCNKQKELIVQTAKNHKIVAELKSAVTTLFQNCQAKYKELDAISIAIGRKLIASGTAAAARDARIAASAGVVHPAPPESKPRT